MKSSSRLIFLSLRPRLSVLQQVEDKRDFVQLAEVGIRRISNDDSDSICDFDDIDGLGFVGECFRENFELPNIGWWFQGVSKVNADSFIATETVAGFVKFEADLHVGDGVGGHH